MLGTLYKDASSPFFSCFNRWSLWVKKKYIYIIFSFLNPHSVISFLPKNDDHSSSLLSGTQTWCVLSQRMVKQLIQPPVCLLTYESTHRHTNLAEEEIQFRVELCNDAVVHIVMYTWDTSSMAGILRGARVIEIHCNHLRFKEVSHLNVIWTLGLTPCKTLCIEKQQQNCSCN